MSSIVIGHATYAIIGVVNAPRKIAVVVLDAVIL